MIANPKCEVAIGHTLKSDKRLSKESYEFDVYSDRWQLDASHTLNFGLLTPLELSPKFLETFRLMLADYACEFSAGHVTGVYVRCRTLFGFGVTGQIREEHIINFKSTLTGETEYKLATIKAFLLDWYDKGFSGINEKVVKLLESLKLKGNQKGKSVATGCPYSGAYSFEEQVAFINWYSGAYADSLITIDEYAFVVALQFTGARPIQISYLYCGDLVNTIEENIEHVNLYMPQVKKRGQRIRESFQLKEDIGEDLASVLSVKAQQSIKTIEKHFDIKLKSDERNIVPLFLRVDKLTSITKFEEYVKRTQQNPDYLCFTKSSYHSLIQRIARLCPLKTNRIMVDGEPGELHINARRFRYTHATNMAVSGASDIAIAMELGHEDTQNVKVYTEFKEEIADRIDEALAPSLVPLAQAFAGTLIDREKDAIRANDPRSRINNNSGNTVGNCGQFGFCANGTIHCYTCYKFQPWVNAPHKEVLESVISQRDRKRQMGASELVLQSHNRTIDAIKVVIQKCEKRADEIRDEGAIDV